MKYLTPCFILGSILSCSILVQSKPKVTPIPAFDPELYKIVKMLSLEQSIATTIKKVRTFIDTIAS
jgi:hypothetical protein